MSIGDNVQDWTPEAAAILRAAVGDRPTREVARLAGGQLSEATWRVLLSGVTTNGRPTRPKDRTIAAAAAAVGVDLVRLFEAAGRRLPDYLVAERDSNISSNPQTRALSGAEELLPHQLALVQAFIDELRQRGSG